MIEAHVDASLTVSEDKFGTEIRGQNLVIPAAFVPLREAFKLRTAAQLLTRMQFFPAETARELGWETKKVIEQTEALREALYAHFPEHREFRPGFVRKSSSHKYPTPRKVPVR